MSNSLKLALVKSFASANRKGEMGQRALGMATQQGAGAPALIHFDPKIAKYFDVKDKGGWNAAAFQLLGLKQRSLAIAI